MLLKSFSTLNSRKAWLAACTLATVPVGRDKRGRFFRAFGVQLTLQVVGVIHEGWNQRITRCFYVFKYSLHKSTVTSRLHPNAFKPGHFSISELQVCPKKIVGKKQQSWTNFKSSQGDSLLAQDWNGGNKNTTQYASWRMSFWDLDKAFFLRSVAYFPTLYGPIHSTPSSNDSLNKDLFVMGCVHIPWVAL